MSSYIIPSEISSLSFDSFNRDPSRDVVCLAPIRTVIRREEEIILVRKVRKVEEIDAGLSCPAPSVAMPSNLLAEPASQAAYAQQTQPAEV
jgi:hypothetical protein